VTYHAFVIAAVACLMLVKGLATLMSPWQCGRQQSSYVLSMPVCLTSHDGHLTELAMIHGPYMQAIIELIPRTCALLWTLMSNGRPDFVTPFAKSTHSVITNDDHSLQSHTVSAINMSNLV
jgi:hypothetical protein